MKMSQFTFKDQIASFEDSMDTYLKNKSTDCILYSEDGGEFKVHKEMFGQTTFLRKILTSANERCCGTVEVFCPCSKDELSHLVKFLYDGEIHCAKEEFDSLKILENLSKIFGFDENLSFQNHWEEPSQADESFCSSTDAELLGDKEEALDNIIVIPILKSINPIESRRKAHKSGGAKRRFFKGNGRRKQSLKCSEFFRSGIDKSDLTQHMEQVHEKITSIHEEKKSCLICVTDFLGSIALKRHIKSVHEGKEPNSCKICDQVFSKYLCLKRHIETVHGGKKQSLKCSECDRVTFRDKSDLKLHMARVHKKIALVHEEKKSCLICAKDFLGRIAMKSHIKSVHEGKEPNSCKICDQVFTRYLSLKVHLDFVHGGKKILKCSECDRDTFRANNELKAHIELVHRKSVLFECRHCGKKLSNMNRKERHENALCIKMPFECELCPYRNQFKLRSSLYRHIKTFHKGKNATILKENVKELKPFSCEKCKKNFSSMDLLKKHEKKNCAIVILKCKYCDKTFLKRKLLTVHERYRGQLKIFFQFLSKFVCRLLGNVQTNGKIDLLVHFESICLQKNSLKS